MKSFVTPHCHQLSFDSASTPEKFAQREIELGTGYTTITDHGTLEGTRKVYDLCHTGQFAGKLKPILGLEAFFRDDDDSIFRAQGISKDSKGTYKEHIKYMHLTTHFMDQQAFEAGSRLLSLADDRAEVHGSERKPLFDWANLEELGSYNVTMTSSCLIGVVGRHLIKNNDVNSAIKYYERLRSIVKPGNWYVEVFPHTCDKNYQVAIYFQYEDGTEESFPVWKGLKTSHGEFKAEQVANEFKAGKGSKHQYLMETMSHRKWTQVENPKRIVNVEKREGFLKNECSVECPDGDVQLRLNKFVIELAEKHGDKIIVSDDSHFSYPEERILQDIRLNQRETEKGLTGSWKFAQSHHRLSTEEAKAYFDSRLPISDKKLEEWIDNSYEWAGKFNNFKFESRRSLPTSFYPQDTLKHTIDLIEKRGRMNWKNPAMVDRLRKEIDLLHKNGTIDLLPYFFIAAEACHVYSQNGLTPGPARGSSAGLLLAYLEGITHIDPLKYDLSMDRFMTLERIKSGKLPDIDMDFGDRTILVGDETSAGWLKQRFGDCASQISTETTLRLKSSIKDVFRAIHGHVSDEIEQFCKRLPIPPQGVTDKDFIRGYDANGEWVPGLIETSQEFLAFTNKYPKEWKSIEALTGLVRSKGRHPCAWAISDVPLSSFIPLTTIGGHKVTQFNYNAVEAMGGLKIDLLTVNVLNDIQEAIKLIQDRANVNVDWQSYRKFNEDPPSMVVDGKKVPYSRVVPQNGCFYDIYDLPTDYDVFNSICDGDTESVFQFNTEAAKQWLKYFNEVKRVENGKEVKTLDSIQALAAFTALDRPGPLDAYVMDKNGNRHNMLVEFANRAKGLPSVGDNEFLNKALPETHGIVVFQESLEKVFKELGQTTAGEAEEFRKATAKKDLKKVLKFKDLFMVGAVPKIGQEQSDDIWNQLVTFGQYGFCIDGTQKIQTDAGLKTMKDVVQSDCLVLTYNEQTKVTEFIKPIQRWCSGIKEVFEVELEDGTTIRATEDHKFLYENGWVSLKELIASKCIETLTSEKMLNQQSQFKKLKIKSIKSLGQREVYDLEVPQNSNFILDGGIVAHNCKSHAVSYVTTSYACAYLKYHFPLEWWTAVLKNAERNEIDEKFWPHCGHLIDIPDVQTSAESFKIVNNRIKAPLSLLHGIGDKAHEQLVKYAPYGSLTDFCEKIQKHKEAGSKEVESETKDKNGLIKKTIKKKLGPSALNTKVINSLIVSGAMDSLFPKTQKIGDVEITLAPVDKILLFQDELERVTGKKITKKARTELLERFKDLTDLQQYQLKKKLLPSYSGAILPMLAADYPSMFSYNKEYYFQPPSTTKPKPKVAVFGANLIAGMRNGQEKGLLPPDGIESGCVAYVIAERRFSYHNNSKTAVELIVDVEGERLKLVKWPDDKNRLPSGFSKNLNGSIVVLTLSKKDGKDIRLNNLYVVESSIDTKNIDKEESPEKED